MNAPIEKQRGFVKLGTTKRLKSPYRDEHFFNSFWAARHEGLSACTRHPSVTHHSPTSPSTPPIPSKFLRFLKGKHQPLEVQLRDWRTPASWRDVSSWLQATYFHFATAEEKRVVAFSLRLRNDVEAKARTKASAASWLQKRMALELQSAAGRQLEFWFVLENAKTGGRGLHLHGEIAAGSIDSTLLRAALRKAAGEWHEVRQHQARTVSAPDEAWVGYVLKDVPWNHKKSIAAITRGFNGAHIAATLGVRSLARTLYEADRRIVCAAGPAARK